MTWQKCSIIDNDLHPSQHHMIGSQLWAQAPITIHTVNHISGLSQNPHYVIRCKTNWIYPEEIVTLQRMEDKHVWMNPTCLLFEPIYDEFVELIYLQDVDPIYKRMLESKTYIRSKFLN